MQCGDLDSLRLTKVLQLKQTADSVTKDKRFGIFLSHDKRSQQFVFILFKGLHKLMLDILQVDMYVLVHQFNVVLAKTLLESSSEFGRAGSSG